MKGIFPVLLLLFSFTAAGQTGALFLKKNGKTVERFYPGRDIIFYTTDGARVQGNIAAITADSLFLMQYQVVQTLTPMGGIRLDTAARFPLEYSIRNIGAFPPQGRTGVKGKTLKGALFLGGTAFMAVNLLNSITQKEAVFERENAIRLGVAAAAAIGGWLMLQKQQHLLVLGNKYSLQVFN